MMGRKLFTAGLLSLVTVILATRPSFATSFNFCSITYGSTNELESFCRKVKGTSAITGHIKNMPDPDPGGMDHKNNVPFNYALFNSLCNPTTCDPANCDPNITFTELIAPSSIADAQSITDGGDRVVARSLALPTGCDVLLVSSHHALQDGTFYGDSFAANASLQVNDLPISRLTRSTESCNLSLSTGGLASCPKPPADTTHLMGNLKELYLFACNTMRKIPPAPWEEPTDPGSSGGWGPATGRTIARAAARERFIQTFRKTFNIYGVDCVAALGSTAGSQVASYLDQLQTEYSNNGAVNPLFLSEHLDFVTQQRSSWPIPQLNAKKLAICKSNPISTIHGSANSAENKSRVPAQIPRADCPMQREAGADFRVGGVSKAHYCQSITDAVALYATKPSPSAPALSCARFRALESTFW
ncbi:MAG: hypothetical protein H7301_04205 [Cryobacterium sp.]|nr:hypothetical protein [Oligoflexia bacterium]